MLTDCKQYDVLIIGAGASGLMCASYLRDIDPSLSVLIVDKNPKAGRKLLATGNGRCNYSNDNLTSDSYNTDDEKKLGHILHSFDTERVIRFFENKLGVISCKKGDLIYPVTLQSKTVTEALTRFTGNSKILYNTQVTSVVKSERGFIVNGSFEAHNVVFATGGVSYPDTGSDGSILPVLKMLAGPGSFERLLPSLVPLRTADNDIKKLAGLRQECVIKMGSRIEKGEIQFTDYGVSGICIMQLSGEYNRSVASGKKINEISVDLIPSMDQKTKEKTVNSLLRSFPDIKQEEALSGLLKAPIAKAVVQRSDKSPSDIARIIGDFRISITGSLGFENAQVTSGGVKLSSLNNGLELIDLKGVYVIGEAVNVDGLCGGFNLHWAWASAMTAAESIIESEEGI